MGFRSPIRPSPFYRFRDEFYWPCVSGEQFPPFLGGIAPTYVTVAGRPALKLAAVPSVCQWPGIPRVGPLAGEPLPVLDLSWWVLLTGNGADGQSSVFVFGDVDMSGGGGSPGPWGTSTAGTYAARLRINARTAGFPLSIDCETSDGVGRQTSLGVASLAAANQWHQLGMLLHATDVTYLFDGAVVATHTARFWPPDAPAAKSWPQAFIPGSPAVTAIPTHVSQVRASYLAS